MKQYLRSRVSIISSYVEILISVLLIISIIMASINLIKDLFQFNKNIFDPSIMSSFEIFLSSALKIIIGIEFVKMLTKHTPESVLEVLLFAIARKMVVDHANSWDILIGISALAILFAIKKYLFTPNISDPHGFVISGATSVKETNAIVRLKLPENLGETIADILTSELNKKGLPLREGSFVNLYGSKIKVYSLAEGQIEMVEVSSLKKFTFP